MKDSYFALVAEKWLGWVGGGEGGKPDKLGAVP